MRPDPDLRPTLLVAAPRHVGDRETVDTAARQDGPYRVHPRRSDDGFDSLHGIPSAFAGIA
jgi:hypothetical protein